MHVFVDRLAMIGMVAGTLALGGCATVDSVKHAQSTADAAVSQAEAAAAAAQRAQTAADQAETDARTVDAKVGHFIDEERAENAAEHARHHHHARHRLHKTAH